MVSNNVYNMYNVMMVILILSLQGSKKKSGQINKESSEDGSETKSQEINKEEVHV